MITETTIHSNHSIQLLQKWQYDHATGKGRVINGKNAGKWMVITEDLKRKILNNGIY